MADYANIPEELKQLKQWVVWGVGNEPLKKPFNPTSMGPAAAGDPTTWSSYPTACGRVQQEKAQGIGFEFHNDGYVGVDLDTVLDPATGELTEDAHRIVKELDSYTEISQSGYGLHIIVKADHEIKNHKKPLPGETKVRRLDEKGRQKKAEIEMYSDKRYFALTGRVYGEAKPIRERTAELKVVYERYMAEKAKPKNAPVEVSGTVQLTNQETIRKAEQSKQGQWFHEMYNGNWQRYYESQSEADQAFCNSLAFWCAKDAGQMDEIFRSSGLMRPEKWDRMTGDRTYGAMTIDKAIADCAQVYEPPRPKAAEDFKSVEERSLVEPLEVFTAAELAEMDLHPPLFLIDGLLPQGTNLMAAAPKTGKSWCALDMAICIAQGMPFMGKETKQAKVLYLALEDTAYRMKNRLKILFGDQPQPKNLIITTRSKKLKEGFFIQLELLLKIHPDIGLVIVDTLQKVKPPSERGMTAYEQDYNEIGMFTEMVKQRDGLSFLLIHHTRKGNGFNNDPFENILGSTALAGAVDTMLVIQKDKRRDDAAVLYVSGKDVPQEEIAIRFNQEQCRWSKIGSLADIKQKKNLDNYHKSPIIKTILAKLEGLEKDENEPIKEFVFRMKDLQQEVVSFTGQVVGENERQFSNAFHDLVGLLRFEDRVEYVQPDRQTRHKGVSGRWHRLRKVEPNVYDDFEECSNESEDGWLD